MKCHKHAFIYYVVILSHFQVLINKKISNTKGPLLSLLLLEVSDTGKVV